jgi:hypothetical protein
MNRLDFLKPRNPLTSVRHRREVFWQITFPVVAFVVILLVLAIMTLGLSAYQASVWADISVIFLIIPALLMAFIAMILLAGGVYLIAMLLQILPFHFFRAQNGLFRLRLQVGRLTDMLVEPMLKIYSFNAAARTFVRQVRRRPAQKKSGE